MSSVVIAGDTSGSITLQAPAVAGTTTHTLPATTGTVLNDATCGVCRAWVKFNGTDTVAIRASFNVSSITDNGVGDYTVNFTSAMPDANYAWAGGGYIASFATAITGNPTTYTKTTSQLRITTTYQNASNATTVADLTDVYVAIFR